ncbi:aspartate-alanine antiporter [Clostridium sardiniense]|uniref:Aspartate-alanine antiporter n=1 Tax=Clostridium sardiniense TaxID=29369 RepID=A0ABS7L145_CLOSR|nr:aspartate-alanine antiporter [Clostridium sardiniense]MBY0756790.1 aspartate-alanine antiporter [Clostridium sardiniense]MDQ0460477.1 putative transport protein [Clostridium sardiniense]
MKVIIDFLEKNPSVAIFFCLALGYLIGKFKYKSFSLGSTVGTLIIGLIIGQFGVFHVSPIVKNIFFSFFIFTIGYEVGPAFVNSLKKSGVKLVIHSVFFSVVAFIVAMICFKVFHVDAGEGAGIIAGSLTQSAVIGTSASAINGLNATAAVKSAMESKVAIAYAITYVFGTVGILIFLKNIAPMLLGVNLKEETKRMIEKIHFKGDASDNSSIVNNIKMRAFLVNEGSSYVGKSVSDIEKGFKNKVTFEKIFKNGEDTNFDQSTVIASGDYITIIGNLTDIVEAETDDLVETSDEKYMNVSLEKSEIMLTKEFNIKNLKDLYSNNIMLESVKRNGKKLEDETEMRNGDILTLIGPKHAISKIIKEFGYVKDNGTSTDVSYLTFGIIVGVLIGTLALTIHDVPLTLGSGGGALFSGLLFGWYQNKHPHFGEIPSSTRWFLKSVGLNLFIAVVGLQAGSAFIPALKSMGFAVLIIGILVCLIPHVLSLYFGKYALKLEPVDIIGSLCGAGTITAALNAITEENGSSIFALSYTPSYAVGNILITIMGPLTIGLLYVH